MKKSFVIIGAGYTGLVAALRLAEAGHKVTILEKGSVVGGLASDFSVEGASLERAYHHIFKTDTDIIGLANELGVGNALKWHESSTSLYYDGKLYPFKGALDLIRFSPISLISRVRAGITTLWLQLDNKWQKYQRISAYDWMQKWAGKQVTNVIWGPLLRGKFDKYFDKVSMAWLWARIHVRASSRETDGEKLGYFDNGFQSFTNALVAKVQALGVDIKTNVDISSILSTSKGVKISTSETNFSFDRCIATVPSGVFAKLIVKNSSVSKKYLQQLQSIDYLGARILIFSSTQNLSPYYWHNINDVDLPFLVFINHTNLIDKKFYNGKYIYYIATYVPHDHELFSIEAKKLQKEWFKGLKTIFKDFDTKKVNEIHTFAFANAQHIVDLDYEKKIPSKKTPVDHVYLSNFSQIFPEDRGTNFAVRDGNAIAQIALDDLLK